MEIHKLVPNRDGININHRKENHFQEEYSIIVNKKDYNGKPSIQSVASLRTYGTKSANYTCIWVNDSAKNIHCSGSGSAGGYGYHRPSQAAQEALNNAGIYTSEDIGGRGDSAIESALIALAKKLGYRKFLIHKAHA